MQTELLWKPIQTMTKKSYKFMKKITHIDDMMIHNLVKYLVQTQLRLWDLLLSGQLVGLKFVILISHKRSWVWTWYFARLCIIISSTYVIFFVNLDDFFAVVCMNFHEKCGLHQIFFLINKAGASAQRDTSCSVAGRHSLSSRSAAASRRPPRRTSWRGPSTWPSSSPSSSSPSSSVTEPPS